MRRRLLIVAGALAAAALATLLLCPPAGAANLKIWKDTFEDNNTNGWYITQSGATIAVDATQGYSGTHSLKVTGNSNANQGAFAISRSVPADFTQDYTVQFAFKYSDFHWDRFLVFGHIRLLLDQPGLPVLYDPIGNNSFVGNQLSANSFQSYLPASTWGVITVHCRPSLRKYWVFMNGTLMGTVTYNVGFTPAARFYFEDNYSVTNHLTAWYDEFAVWGMQNPSLVKFIKPGLTTDFENDTTVWAHPPDVPYHCQYQFPDIGLPALSEANSPWRASGDNHRCMVASLDMVFNRFELIPPANQQPNPQEEIAAASNTNDRDTWNAPLWKGTTSSDCRRAAHFSILTQALTAARKGAPPAGQPKKPGRFGYTWRDLGYSAVDSVWTSVARQDSVDFAGGGIPTGLETLIASGYPLLACFVPPANWLSEGQPDNSQGEKDTTHVLPDTTVEGHCVVIIGYDNLGGQGGSPLPAGIPGVLIHDPGVGKYLWYRQQYFFGQVWKFGKFLFAAPWEVMWLSHASVVTNSKFDGSALVTYTGPKPLSGCYPVNPAQAKVTLTGFGLQGGEVATHNLANIATSGDWDYTTWKLQAPAGIPIGGASVTCSGYGTMTSTASTSYRKYADKIGTKRTTAIGIIFIPGKLNDLGQAGWPYGDGWWRSGTGGAGLQVVETGGLTVDVSGLVANMGQYTSPPTALMRFYWDDPCVTEKAPGAFPIGDGTIPALAPGDTFRVHMPWTRPPVNSMGESFFDVFVEILWVADPPYDPWPQDENNYGALADFAFDLQPGDSAAMRLRVRNPETAAMKVALVVEREEAAQYWEVLLTDSLGTPLPVGVPMPIDPSGSYQARVAVIPVGEDSIGHVHVEGWLYTTGGVLVREMGGITLSVKWHPPVAGVGPRGPAVLALAQNRPNPFTRATTIHYSIPRDGRVSLRVYDVAGRLVATLADGPQAAGPHHVVWDGSGATGSRVSTGLYFCRLEVQGAGGITRRMLLLR